MVGLKIRRGRFWGREKSRFKKFDGDEKRKPVKGFCFGESIYIYMDKCNSQLIFMMHDKNQFDFFNIITCLRNFLFYTYILEKVLRSLSNDTFLYFI